MIYYWLGWALGGAVVAWIVWEMRRAPVEKNHMADWDDAAMDDIRDELERQAAPHRPHIRSVQ